MTANSAPIMLSRSKFFIRITSRMLPAKHIRLFCANAPIRRAATREIRTGACLLPGPSVLAAYTPVTAPMIKSARRSTGSTYPLDFCVSYALPSENPFFRKNEPVAIPPANPTSATYAFRSPAAIRRTIRSGHPKNTSAPITMIAPRTKRIIGEEPAVALYSFVTSEIANAPTANPTISGRKY